MFTVVQQLQNDQQKCNTKHKHRGHKMHRCILVTIGIGRTSRKSTMLECSVQIYSSSHSISSPTSPNRQKSNKHRQVSSHWTIVGSVACQQMEAIYSLLNNRANQTTKQVILLRHIVDVLLLPNEWIDE